MLSFTGEKDLAVPQGDVWSKVRDARFLLQCVPDVETISHADAETGKCTIRPGFAFVRGTLDLTISVADADPSGTVRLQLTTRGIGSTSEVGATLETTSSTLGTHLRWTVEIVTLGGLLKAVPAGLVRAAAQKVIADALSALERRLAGEKTG